MGLENVEYWAVSQIYSVYLWLLILTSSTREWEEIAIDWLNDGSEALGKWVRDVETGASQDHQ